MVKEIEQLRQIQNQRDIFSSLADKREKQHSQLGQNLGQVGIERDIRIGQVMERTLNRWQRLSEQTEALDQKLNEESVKVNDQVQKLRELSERNPVIVPIVTRYEEELVSLGFRNIPEVKQAKPEKPIEPQQTEEVKPVRKKTVVGKKPDKVVTKAVKGEEVELLSGQEVVISGKLKSELLKAVDEGMSSPEGLAVRIYGEDTPAKRKALNKLMNALNKDLSDFRLRVINQVPPRARFQGVQARYNLRSIDEPQLQIAPWAEVIEATLPKEPEEILAEGRRIRIVPKEEIEELMKAEKPSERRGYIKDSVILGFYERKPRNVTLPNGQVIETDSAWPYYLAQFIADGTNSVGEMAEKVYGEDNKKNRGRVNAAIAAANRTIKNSGYKFANITSRSDSNRGIQSKFEWHDPSGNAVILRKHEVVLPPKVPDTIAEVIEIPYTPSEDEIRSDEETRIVIALTSMLKNSSVIDFAVLQRLLRTEDRIKTLHRQRMYRPYQADELRSLFASGLKKLQEESLSPVLRKSWTENDEKAWVNIQTLVARLAGGSFEEFIKEIQRLINRATRGFYEPHDGKAVEWIKLPPGNGE